MDFAAMAWSVLEVAAILQLHHTTKLLLRPCCLQQMLLTRNGTEPCIHKNFKSGHAQHMKQQFYDVRIVRAPNIQHNLASYTCLARLLSSVPPVLIGLNLLVSRCVLPRLTRTTPAHISPVTPVTISQTFAVLPESQSFCFQLSSLLSIVPGKTEERKVQQSGKTMPTKQKRNDSPWECSVPMI